MAEEDTRKPMKTKKQIVLEYAEAIITALILALIIRAYVVQAFKIPSGSMLDTLQIGDHILVNKFIFGTDLPFTDKKVLAYRDPQRGDIIVFKYPQDQEKDFIKRIIAVGGDVVEGRNKQIFVNGKPIKDESYAIYQDPEIRPPGQKRDTFGPVYVPEGKYFVMGDNRDFSHDSRYWGFVDRNLIKGKALIIYWSWNGEKHFPRFGRIGNVVR